MSNVQTNLTTTVVVGDETIIVAIATDPDVESLPVMLTWSADGVTTQEEFYASVPIALARVAAITLCGSIDWDSGLSDNPLNFGYRAHTFLVDSIDS